MEYHVSIKGNDGNRGTIDEPFETISKAAQIAVCGDIVIVHDGVYREWVKPTHGGRSSARRITYQAAHGKKVVIKGSEQVTGWQKSTKLCGKQMCQMKFLESITRM